MQILQAIAADAHAPSQSQLQSTQQREDPAQNTAAAQNISAAQYEAAAAHVTAAAQVEALPQGLSPRRPHKREREHCTYQVWELTFCSRCVGMDVGAGGGIVCAGVGV